MMYLHIRYYPNIMLKCGYVSRSIPSPMIFQRIVDERLEAKAKGDKVTANNLKLVVNSTYGIMLDRFNPVCDPLMARSVCITGQLFLCELAGNLTTNIPTIKLIQLNTDGIMISFEEEYYPQVTKIVNEWQMRTGFELEEDKLTYYNAKDCNNYIAIFEDGHSKCKGGYLVRGVSPAGAFNVNNNFPIVSKAVVDYFTKGTQPELTVAQCNDRLQFQIIAKASGKYSGVVQEIGGEQIPVQRCNRVYATNLTEYGTLYKIHKETGKPSKIANLPPHCLVDNKNTISIDEINKKWYIDLAWKYIKDYIGDDDKMATATKKPNIYEKLMLARVNFGLADKKKSGVNAHAEFKYYELQDIVPIATKVFSDLGLAFYTSFEGESVVGYLIDIDSNEDITFKVPFATIAEPGKFRQNEIQAMGGAITYFRRYMYMLVLDIVEPDAFDGGDFGKAEPKAEKPKPYTPKAPATAEERKEITAKLTNADEKADAEHIAALKNTLKTLKALDPSYEDEIQKLVTDTKVFKELSNAQTEELITKYGKIVIEKQKEQRND